MTSDNRCDLPVDPHRNRHPIVKFISVWSLKTDWNELIFGLLCMTDKFAVLHFKSHIMKRGNDVNLQSSSTVFSLLNFFTSLNRGSDDHDFLIIWLKLKFYGQNGQANFDHDHFQNFKIFVVKMVNPNSIRTIFKIWII
jgi:hypothetical protein